MKQRKDRLAAIILLLEQEYPNASCALIYRTPFQLLVATILSAQCTDERVNKVTAPLFKQYPTASDMAKLPTEEIAQMIYTTGLYNHKANSVSGLSNILMERYDGEVPQTIEELVALPGVGRKTANVVLGNAFQIPGLAVDTHVIRLMNLLGLVQSKDAVKIEKVLMDLVPQQQWTQFSHLVISHGRRICIARRPQCSQCVLANLCPSSL